MRSYDHDKEVMIMIKEAMIMIEKLSYKEAIVQRIYNHTEDI